jgi:hydroxymethylpyrimidine pyrophosphatase-like HAD family hydrolase
MTILKYISKRFDIDRQEIIAIGDNENDISMLNYAGLGVAMGNAAENTKKASDIITSTNDEDGVSKVIEKYILEIGDEI